MASVVTLNCLIYGDLPARNTFPMEVSKNINFGKLKELIKASRQPRLDGVDAAALVLKKVNISRSRLRSLRPDTALDVFGGEELMSLDEIQESFSDEPGPKYLHVLVVRLDIVGMIHSFPRSWPSLLSSCCLSCSFCRFVVSGWKA